jgi:hypothetical protein
MSEARPLTVAVAGADGVVGRALVKLLAGRHRGVALSRRATPAPVPDGVSTWRCDLLSTPETEVALAGADVVVFLARTSRPAARLVQADAQVLDLVLADSVARAAPRTSVRRVVHFACGDADPREGLLRLSGLPVSVLRGGGADPAQALLELVEDESAREVSLPAWTRPAADDAPGRGDALVCSVQHTRLPAGWSAEQVAWAYVGWLNRAVPLVRVERIDGCAIIRAAGTPVLMLRHAPGRSEPDSFVFEVRDGMLADAQHGPGRFEFRVLLDRSALVASLQDYTPSLPWPVYRVTQALAHSAVMRRFGVWLQAQPPPGAQAA